MEISFTLNGIEVSCDVHPAKRLLDVLREDFGLTGTKEACGRGECGSCTVLLNGMRVNACLIPIFQVCGQEVLTIEGISVWPIFERIERAFLERGAVQCGFCIPGIVVSAVAVLQELPPNTDLATIRAALAGNLCRCTGYEKIVDAVMDLAEDREFRRALAGLWNQADE